jgi:dipeptidyl aminopeptidase/acylaminoacyl peptidase
LQPNLDIIGNISSNTSILILQGENETQTPVQQAFLLQQKLTDVGHPDHTLITYPNLGHNILSVISMDNWCRPNRTVCFGRYLFMA